MGYIQKQDSKSSSKTETPPRDQDEGNDKEILKLKKALKELK